MKFIRTLLIAGLAISIVLNFMLYWKNERLKPQFVINGHTFTKRQYHDWLEQHYGLQTQAAMVKYYLITDAAKKAHVMPDAAEVNRMVADQEESTPGLAARLQREPWLHRDLLQSTEEQLAILNLATSGAKPSEEQLKTTYESFGSAAFDEPTKIYIRILGSTDQDVSKHDDYLQRAKGLVDGMAQRSKVEQPSPGVQQKLLPDLNMVQAQLAPHIGFYYGDGRVMLKSTDPSYATVSGLKVGDSALVTLQGLGRVLVYVEKRVEGRKSSLSDPATRKKVELQYKMMQGGGKMTQQKLRELWDSATIQTDPESTKSMIEPLLFPERAASKSK